MFDALGTLVDAPAGIRAGLRALDPSLDNVAIEWLLSLWQHHIEHEQRRILEGDRAYATSGSSTGKAPGWSPTPSACTTRPPSRSWRWRVTGSPVA